MVDEEREIKKLMEVKNMFKKMLSVVLAVSMVFALGVSGFASNIKPFSVYEYDAIIAQRNQGVLSSINRGISQAVAEKEINREVEQSLLELSKLPKNVLIEDYGYSSQEVATLKNYQGENLEDYPELRKAMGRLSGFISCVEASTQSITGRMYWNWTTPPAYMPFEDAVSISYDASSPNSDTMNVRIDKIKSGGTITYYEVGGGKKYSETVDLTVMNRYHNVETRFERMGTSLQEYAKTGNILIKVDSGGDGSIGEVSFGYAYGLKDNSNVDLSFSIPIGASIEVEEGGTLMIYEDAVITANGTLV